MKLESQLLKIIEEQQLQLQQQQQKLAEALEYIHAQSATIEQLQSYTKTLNEKQIEAANIVTKYQQIVRQLSEQSISATLPQTLQNNLQVQLQARLSDLVQNLQIDSLVKQEMADCLPRLVQAEIENQTAPLAKELNEKIHSAQQYHKKFEDLIHQISSRL